ncbi:MAG: YafY family transcriptional regulator [Gammaproteobacteria bacterium]|nr:YafY family transcriptional regulator [Gammaproteobacteria bacterium]
MRADRLIQILTTLQARGRATASELAEETEVSLRTIYRDIDSLALAGIPVYAEHGAQGGYRLLNGYKVQLNGMSQAETHALFLSGLGSTLSGLGLDAATLSAEKKLAAALPEPMRKHVHHLRKRFHLDVPGWFNEAEQPTFLQAVFDAVCADRQLHMRYRSWQREKNLELAPLGVVLKGGAWYLVGQTDAKPRTYKITRILSLEVLDTTFTPPAEFNLAAYWQENTARLDEETHSKLARVRVSPLGLRILPDLCSSYVRRRIRLLGKADENGWQELELPVGGQWQTISDFLRLGIEVEVLAPQALRDAVRSTVNSLAERYR